MLVTIKIMYNLFPPRKRQLTTVYMVLAEIQYGMLDLQLHVQSPTTTEVVSSNLVRSEVHSIQHYVIKFVSDLLHVGGFLRIPPPFKLTTTI